MPQGITLRHPWLFLSQFGLVITESEGDECGNSVVLGGRSRIRNLGGEWWYFGVPIRLLLLSMCFRSPCRVHRGTRTWQPVTSRSSLCCAYLACSSDRAKIRSTCKAAGRYSRQPGENRFCKSYCKLTRGTKSSWKESTDKDILLCC